MNACGAVGSECMLQLIVSMLCSSRQWMHVAFDCEHVVVH